MTDHWADYYGQRGLCGEYDPFFHQRPKYKEPTTNDKDESQATKARTPYEVDEDLGGEEFERDQEGLERDFSNMGGNAI